MGPGQGNTIVVKDGGSCSCSCRCWCCRPLMLLLLLLLFLRCCCSCRAINQPPRRETNSQTSFSKLTRNSKTPPNFVPKMAQNRSKKVPNVSSEIPENPRLYILENLRLYIVLAACWLLQKRGSRTGKHHSSEERRQLQLQLPLLVLSSADAAAAAAALAVPALLLLLPCHQPASKARNQTAKHHLISCQKWRKIAVKDGGSCSCSCRCWCCRPLMLLLLFLRCCCSCRAINQPPRRKTNSQTSFSKLTRNSKTPPNFVPKMAQNRSKKVPNVSSEILENPRES